MTPERHTAEPAQPVSEREGYDAQGAPASGRPEGDSPRGVFVTFEGGDGVGKSTHIRYVANELRRTGRERRIGADLNRQVVFQLFVGHLWHEIQQ